MPLFCASPNTVRRIALTCSALVIPSLIFAQSDALAEGLQKSLSSERSESLIELTHPPATYQSCLPCHGAHAEGQAATRAPALAGQHRWYLERQLEHFQDGARGSHSEDLHGAAMRAMAIRLQNTESMESILDTIDDFPAPSPQSTLNGDRKAGAERYAMSCANCHGDDAEGIESLNAPKLNTLQDWYIVRQLKSFQEGYRGQHEGDLTGQEMRPMAMSVYTEKEMRDVATYILSLRAEAEKTD